MKSFRVNNFYVRLMNHDDASEVRMVQKLRYDHLLKEYNPSLPDEGIDIDGYDEYTDSIIVFDCEKQVIAGTYRVATLETIKGHKFLMEDEYDITPLRMSNEGIVELGRAVVRPDYRTGFVIQLLFLAIYRYTIEHNCKYMVGLCSFHGNDPTIYAHGLSYLKHNYACTKFMLKAKTNAYPLDMVDVDKINMALVKEQLPSLLRAYLKLGHKVSYDGCIDYQFNSCDVLIILDVDEVNVNYMHRILSIKATDVVTDGK